MSGKPLPYANKGDLTNGPVQKHLVRMALPMVWSIFSVMAVQLANTWWISMLGTRELAAIGYTFPVAMVVSNLVFGINIALSSVVSRLIGEKKIEDVKRVTLHGIMLGLTVSGTIALFTYVFLERIFHGLGADETVMPVIRAYMPLWLVSSVILAVPINANSAIRASGDTLQPSLIMLGMAVINFLLDPVLIFGLLGAPRFGVAGGAISTMISYSCAAAGILYLLIVRKKMVSTDSLHLDKLKDSLKRLVHIAIPAGLANIIQPLTGGMITALLAFHGHEAVAAYGVAQRVEGMAMLAIIALAVGLAPIVGQNWGAGKYDRVHEVIGLAIRFNFIWSLGLAVLMALFAGNIARGFSDEPTVVHDTTLYFWIMPFTYAFGNLVFGWSSAFNSMGMPQKALVMIVTKSALTVPAAWIGGHYYGVAGIFAGMAAVNLISGIAFHFISNAAMHRVEKPGLAPEPLIE